MHAQHGTPNKNAKLNAKREPNGRRQTVKIKGHRENRTGRRHTKVQPVTVMERKNSSFFLPK